MTVSAHHSLDIPATEEECKVRPPYMCGAQGTKWPDTINLLVAVCSKIFVLRVRYCCCYLADLLLFLVSVHLRGVRATSERTQRIFMVAERLV